jgi:hypothetical protein
MLNAEDLRTPTWRRAREQFEARLATARLQLEKDTDPVTTAKLRGRIAELKELLALQTPAQASDPALAALGIVAARPFPNENETWS